MSDRDRSTQRAAIVFSNLGHAYTHLFTILYATAVLYLPQVFGRPYGELLGLSSLGLLLFGLAALPAGWLGDRWSQVGMMILLFLGLGAGAALTGLAESPAGLFVGLSVMGLFAAIYHPVGIAWIVAAADGSSEVAGALDEVATIYRRRLDRAVDRVTTLIVPLAEIVLGAIVFMLAYAYIVPLFEWQRNLFGI